MANKLSDEKKQLILEAIKQYPTNMKKAAEWVPVPFNTFVYRAKLLGVYNPNPNQREERQKTARAKSWNDASMTERRRRVLEEQ